MVRILGEDKSYVKTWTTNTLDKMEESRRPRMRKLGELIGMFIPRDWGNFFS